MVESAWMSCGERRRRTSLAERPRRGRGSKAGPSPLHPMQPAATARGNARQAKPSARMKARPSSKPNGRAFAATRRAARVARVIRIQGAKAVWSGTSPPLANRLCPRPDRGPAAPWIDEASWIGGYRSGRRHRCRLAVSETCPGTRMSARCRCSRPGRNGRMRRRQA